MSYIEYSLNLAYFPLLAYSFSVLKSALALAPLVYVTGAGYPSSV